MDWIWNIVPRLMCLNTWPLSSLMVLVLKVVEILGGRTSLDWRKCITWLLFHTSCLLSVVLQNDQLSFTPMPSFLLMMDCSPSNGKLEQALLSLNWLLSGYNNQKSIIVFTPCPVHLNARVGCHGPSFHEKWESSSLCISFLSQLIIKRVCPIFFLAQAKAWGKNHCSFNRKSIQGLCAHAKWIWSLYVSSCYSS